MERQRSFSFKPPTRLDRLQLRRACSRAVTNPNGTIPLKIDPAGESLHVRLHKSLVRLVVRLAPSRTELFGSIKKGTDYHLNLFSDRTKPHLCYWFDMIINMSVYDRFYSLILFAHSSLSTTDFVCFFPSFDSRFQTISLPLCLLPRTQLSSANSILITTNLISVPFFFLVNSGIVQGIDSRC